MCAAQAVTYDDYGNEIPDVVATDPPVVTCDPAPAADQPATDQAQEDVVVSDPRSMDSARFARRLHR